MTLNSVSSNVVKIAQAFAFGIKRANQGGLPGITIGFFQQSLDSWRAFVIIIAELSRAKRASGAPWVRKFGKLSIR